jgi:hypothetical protein
MCKKWFMVLLLAFVLTTPLLGCAEKNNEVSSIVEVFLDVASEEKEIIELEAKIEYVRRGAVEDFVLNFDEAGDKAFGTVVVAYRKAAKKIPTSILLSDKGKALLKEKASDILERHNDFRHEPVKVIDVTVTAMTLNPDEEKEALGRPAIFFLHEESGDAKAGI